MTSIKQASADHQKAEEVQGWERAPGCSLVMGCVLLLLEQVLGALPFFYLHPPFIHIYLHAADYGTHVLYIYPWCEVGAVCPCASVKIHRMQ